LSEDVSKLSVVFALPETKKRSLLVPRKHVFGCLQSSLQSANY
jgi:hypothetical protein